MVVVIAGISFCGHFAVRLLGTRSGLVLTSMLAGLASSTALTLQFARLNKEQGGLGPSAVSRRICLRVEFDHH